VLTRLAEADLRRAKRWSLSRWGTNLTREYFRDLHDAANFVAAHPHSLSNREDIAGDSGLSVHPVREHYLIYLTVADKYVVIVSVIRQTRDVPDILRRAQFLIRREVTEIRGRIRRGELLLP